MTEIVILRIFVASSLIWFCISEWWHAKQLDAMFQAGFRYAVKNHIKKVQTDVDDFFKEFQTSLRIIEEAIQRDEQTNAKRTGTEGNPEIKNTTHEADDAE